MRRTKKAKLVKKKEPHAILRRFQIPASKQPAQKRAKNERTRSVWNSATTQRTKKAVLVFALTQRSTKTTAWPTLALSRKRVLSRSVSIFARSQKMQRLSRATAPKKLTCTQGRFWKGNVKFLIEEEKYDSSEIRSVVYHFKTGD
jgi:hypothetical protein